MRREHGQHTLRMIRLYSATFSSSHSQWAGSIADNKECIADRKQPETVSYGCYRYIRNFSDVSR